MKYPVSYLLTLNHLSTAYRPICTVKANFQIPYVQGLCTTSDREESATVYTPRAYRRCRCRNSPFGNTAGPLLLNKATVVRILPSRSHLQGRIGVTTVSYEARATYE